MVKQKINASDVFVLINEFKTKLLNARLNNVYDINSKCFLLKLTAASKEKYFVLLDSNPQSPRFQITHQNFERRMIPSSFCTKLRKHLTNKKMTMIRQLGSDRIVDIQFGSDNKFHLIMELYDSGNLILTDNDYSIMTLVRRYAVNLTDETDLIIKVGNTYPTDQKILNINDISKDELKTCITESFPDDKKNSLRNVFISNKSPVVNLGKDIIYHAIHSLGWSPTKKIKMDLAITFPIDKFLEILIITIQALNGSTGFIMYEDENKENKDDFVPILYSHVKNKPYNEYSSMSDVLDEYFKLETSVEQKAIKKDIKKEEETTKLHRLKETIDTRIGEFETKKDKTLDIAEYLSENMESFNFLLNFNPLDFAEEINKIKVISVNKKNTTCVVRPNDFECDIELDYTQNIWNNIRNYHLTKKAIKTKIEKTKVGGTKAIEKMEVEQKKEKKRKAPLIPLELKEKLEQIVIKEFWFEKFKWFISSEGYLVLLGKDMHQNELLVKKYLTNNDVYLHSDTHGSGSCIIKNILTEENNIPSPISLTQAASFIICNSKAWNYNSPDRAYWVYSNQVSKTPESGEYMSTGSFIIRGKKNYIITTLQLGFSFLFKKKGELEEKNLLTQANNNDIEWVIPILAPYSSLRDCKFKAKIVPGKNKKGKAYKAIIDHFCSKKDIEPIEKFLIRKIKDGSDILPGNLYFSFPS